MRFLLCFVLGGMAGLAFPPYGLWPLVAVGFSGFAFLLRSHTSLYRAFALWWGFALGYHGVILYWSYKSLVLGGGQHPGWMIPLAMFGVPAYLALFHGGAGLLYRWLIRHRYNDPWMVSIGLPACWVLAEMLQSVIGFRFPWSLVGYTADQSLVLLQSTSVIGIHGVSLLIVFWALLLWGCWWRQYRIIALMITSMVLVFFYGWERLQDDPPADTSTRVRLVQPNIAQVDKWKPDAAARHYQQLRQLSEKPAETQPDLVIWPETASAYDLSRGGVQPLSHGAVLMTGFNRYHHAPEVSFPSVWNSMGVFDANGQMIDVYDKYTLLPFGEYVPLRDILPLERIAPFPYDFSRGTGVRTLVLPQQNIPSFSPLICYEVVLSGRVVHEELRPSWLVTISNDAWFGQSPGPYQHMAIARVRAIEEGLPLVRVANTGISAVVDAYGRYRVQSAMNTEVVIDHPLPAPLPKQTIFARLRHWLVWGLLALCFGVLLWRRYRCRGEGIVLEPSK